MTFPRLDRAKEVLRVKEDLKQVERWTAPSRATYVVNRQTNFLCHWEICMNARARKQALHRLVNERQLDTEGDLQIELCNEDLDLAMEFASELSALTILKKRISEQNNPVIPEEIVTETVERVNQDLESLMKQLENDKSLEVQQWRHAIAAWRTKKPSRNPLKHLTRAKALFDRGEAILDKGRH